MFPPDPCYDPQDLPYRCPRWHKAVAHSCWPPPHSLSPWSRWDSHRCSCPGRCSYRSLHFYRASGGCSSLSLQNTQKCQQSNKALVVKWEHLIVLEKTSCWWSVFHSKLNDCVLMREVCMEYWWVYKAPPPPFLLSVYNRSIESRLRVKQFITLGIKRFVCVLCVIYIFLSVSITIKQANCC